MQRKVGELKNRGVVYKGERKVVVEDIPFPSLEIECKGKKKECEHGAIIKIIASNICGSDGHMFRGRTPLKPDFVFGHEMTGEVIQIGKDVEQIKVGDIVSVPFNVACGRCKNCRLGLTNACLTTNDEQPGGIYGYVLSGNWQGGQSEYNFIPYADFNLLKIPNKDLAMKKILDISMLSDVLPTGFHAAYSASVGSGSTVYVAGAGPVGLACARSCFLLGSSAVIVGDTNHDRLKLAKKFGCLTLDLTDQNIKMNESIDRLLGEPVVDAAIDCVGFEARGHGFSCDHNHPNQAINACIESARFGGSVGIPGVYLTEDPKAQDSNLQKGKITLDFGKGWVKGLTFTTGQTPVARYNEKLMKCILWDRLSIADVLNTTVISLDQAPKAYEEFNEKGVPKKFVIDPHRMISSPH